MTVCIPRPRFHLHVLCFFFFFFLPAFVDFGGQILLLWTVYALFTYCAYTVYVLKNIKNGSHDIIYTFKYYFATVFSIFSNNKFNPNTPYIKEEIPPRKGTRKKRGKNWTWRTPSCIKNLNTFYIHSLLSQTWGRVISIFFTFLYHSLSPNYASLIFGS